MQKLLILSTQRSGSTMICSDISSTGILGHPNEYFINTIDLWQRKEARDKIIDSINKISINSSTSNGVQAVKIMSNQISIIGLILQKLDIAQGSNNLDCFFSYFSDYVFIRVVREDKVAQAVSRVMAEKTGIYHYIDSSKSNLKLGRSSSNIRSEAGAVYSYDLIQDYINRIISEEQFLDDFINRYSIKPLNLLYETSIESREYINDITGLLSLPQITNFEERSLKKIGGEISKSWIRQFKEDKKNCNDG